MDTDEEWVEDDQMAPELRAKLLVLKICRKRCLAHGKSDEAVHVAEPALRMFFTLLDFGGSFSESAEDE